MCCTVRLFFFTLFARFWSIRRQYFKSSSAGLTPEASGCNVTGAALSDKNGARGTEGADGRHAACEQGDAHHAGENGRGGQLRSILFDFLPTYILSLDSVRVVTGLS